MSQKSLAVFFTYGGTVESWFNSGYLQRELDYYKQLGKYFNKIYWVTYGGNDSRYQKYLPQKIEILHKKINLHDSIYSFLIPLLYGHKLKKVDYYKSNQILGAWSAQLSKLIFRKKLYLRSGYTIALSPEKKSVISSVVERIAYRYFDFASVTTQEQKNYLIKKYKLSDKKIKVIPNYINTEIFTPVKIKNKKTKLLYVGRLEPEKNVISVLK